MAAILSRCIEAHFAGDRFFARGEIRPYEHPDTDLQFWQDWDPRYDWQGYLIVRAPDWTPGT